MKIASLQPDVKAKDLELWRSWKRTKDPQTLQKLLTQMNPIINREVSRWAASMSRSLLEAEGRRLAVKAFNEFEDNRGVALSTFVASRLPKLSRLVYANQNTARLSETKALLFHSYNAANNELRDIHGRNPTSDELSDHLGWHPKKLEEFQRQSSRKEYIESEEHPDFDDGSTDHFVDFIYHDLTPLQKQIFEYTTGYLGAPKLTGAKIMKKLGITQGQLSYQKALIVKIVEKAQGKK